MKSEKEFATLDDTMALISRYRILFFSVVFTSLLAATALAFWLDKFYRAETLLVAAEQQGGQDQASLLGGLAGLGGLADLAGINIGPQDKSFEHSAILTSYSFLMSFVEDEDLMTELFYRDWNEEEQSWDDDPPENWDAYLLLTDDVVSLERDVETGLLALTVEWRTPELAAEWSNKLMARLNLQTRSRAIAEAEKSIAYLTSELEKTSVLGVQQGINDLIESQINKIMLANVQDEFAFRVIDPAIPPAADDHERPIRWLFALAGAILGIVLGSFAVGIRARMERG